jgi:hypothetical protein
MPVSLLVQSLMAFNLVCTGSSVSVHGGGIHGQLRPMSVVFRIDLDANRFCSDACAETQPIASVTYGDVVLQDETDRVSGEAIYRTVRRESGRYYADRRTGVGRKLKRVLMVGDCERAPFTGFPVRKF